MNKTLTFNLSTIASTASKFDDDAFDRSIEEFEEKKYRQSFCSLLDYLDGGLRTKYGNAGGNEFTIPHGSIIVHLQIEGEELKITAPFLSLPEKGRVPLLRQVAGLNFNILDLAAVVLRGNHLAFEYRCPLALVEPYKMYYILREICSSGDRYDDEFVTKFGAVRVYEPRVTPYDAPLVDTIYDVIQLSCREALDAVKEFESARKYGYAWNILNTTLMKVLYYAHPQGQLLNDLNKAVWNMDREDIPLPEIVTQGRQAVERLRQMPKEALAEELYFVETFVPDKRRSSLKNIQENFEDAFENLGKAFENDDWLYCCMVITFQFYKLYFYNNVQDDVNAIIVDALKQSSAKPLDEAAPVLYKAMEKIMKGDLTPPAENPMAGVDMSAYMNMVQQHMQNANMTDFAQQMQSLMSSFFGGGQK
ncbi:MAG: YbjN domain-containing protein [Prevotellaceae bacterium]|jgi:hypothetical protein|nr:YbjN domain-containing protein [Prevotellaceae bacterium]